MVAPCTLYRGDYLADCPYEEWATTAREAYRTAYLTALERVAALAEELDLLADATDAAARMLRVDPCREEDAHRTLMRCHAPATTGWRKCSVSSSGAASASPTRSG